MIESTAMVATLLLVSVGVLVVYSIVSYRRKQRRASSLKGSAPGSALQPPAPFARSTPSAAQAQVLAASLQASGAQWPEIMSGLNPGNDSQVDRTLAAIRGPHLFDPHTGLTVIRHGCTLAIARDPAASNLAGFLEAKEDMDKVIRAGD